MTTMRPDEVAAMFDLPPLPAASPPTLDAAHAAQAEEAALAAELAADLELGVVAADAPDSRTDQRVAVAWPGRMQWPDGRVIELEVRNISEGGMGWMSDEHIPCDIVADFEMDVPALDEGGKTTLVKGTIKTAYTLAQGSETVCGGTWQGPPAGLEFVNRWIKGRPR